MDAYIYQAALLCGCCGEVRCAELGEAGQCPEDPDDEATYDSDDYPKGPYPEGGGESDSPCHCDHCGGFLENPLTTEGYEYVKEKIEEAVKEGRMDSPAITVQAPFYGLEILHPPVGEGVSQYKYKNEANHVFIVRYTDDPRLTEQCNSSCAYDLLPEEAKTKDLWLDDITDPPGEGENT